jgi:hypothetical protein
MSNMSDSAALQRALGLSQEALAAAEKSDVRRVELLDAERMELLKSLRLELKRADAAAAAVLRQIAQLNDRTLGLIEHLRRGKARDMDMAAMGRRAVAAYANSR